MNGTMMMAESLYDVVIVGAGAAGMTAGYELHRRGLNVTILEASPTFGGRLRADNDLVDYPVDLGAGWIHEFPGVAPNRAVLDLIVNNPSVTVGAKTSFERLLQQNFEDGEPTDQELSDELNELWINSTWFSFFADYIQPTVADIINYNCIVNNVDYSNQDFVALGCEDGRIFRSKRAIVTASLGILQSNLITYNPPPPSEMTRTLREDYTFLRAYKAFFSFSENFYPNLPAFAIYPPFYDDDSTDNYVFWDASNLQNTSANVLGLLLPDSYLQEIDGLNDVETRDRVLEILDTVFNGRASETYLNHTSVNWDKEPFFRGSWVVEAPYDSFRCPVVEAPLAQPLDGRIYFAGDAIGNRGQYGTVPSAALSGQNVACLMVNGVFDNTNCRCTFPPLGSILTVTGPQSSANQVYGGASLFMAGLVSAAVYFMQLWI